MSTRASSIHSSTRHSWASARLERETRTPSISQHQVTPPTRVLTPPTQPQSNVFPTSRRISPPRQHLFSSLDPQDDESIHSTDSIGPNIMVIQPCSDYTKYGTWLRK